MSGKLTKTDCLLIFVVSYGLTYLVDVLIEAIHINPFLEATISFLFPYVIVATLITIGIKCRKAQEEELTNNLRKKEDDEKVH